MKYYTIESVTKNKTTNEVVGSGSFLVKVDSEDEVKALIKDMVENQESSEYYEADFRYHECSEKEYVRYKEDEIIRRAKLFFYEKLKKEIDPSLTVKEYNKIKHSKDNEAKAVDYFLKLEAAFRITKKHQNLEEISAKEFLNMIESLANQN